MTEQEWKARLEDLERKCDVVDEDNAVLKTQLERAKRALEECASELEACRALLGDDGAP